MLKVSIAMPVYNGGHYFELALQSALAQTYPNTEIVIVNDGSTDQGETASISEKYAAKYRHIKYIIQENRGAGGALNSALRVMTGDIFTWLSHDDLFEPNKTERQVLFFERLGKHNAMLFSDWTLIGSDGELLTEVVYDHSDLVEHPRSALLLGKINGITLFIPRFILEEFGGFDERYRFVQDYDLWRKVTTKYDFFHQPEKLIRYRSHPGQDSNKPGMVLEANELWIRMMDQCTAVERAQMFGSSYLFYRRIATYLAGSQCQIAKRHAEERAQHFFGAAQVSVVVAADAASPALATTLHSLKAQIPQRPEIIIADTSVLGLPEPITSQEVTRLVMPGVSAAEAMTRAVSACRGEYIAFARPGVTYVPDRLSRQMRSMQLAGRTISYTSFSTVLADEAPRADDAATQMVAARSDPSKFRLETLMVHRADALGGLGLDVWSDHDTFIFLARHAEPLFLPEPLALFPSGSGSVRGDR
jgi:glycosyltransferase involved in cell wall biosynthesis